MYCVGGGVGERQSEDSSVCFGVKPHKGLACLLSYKTGRGKSVPEQ